MCGKQLKYMYTNKSRCCYDQDAVVLFRLSNLGAFVFEFTLDAVIIKSAVVFAPIRYFYFTPPTAFRIFHYTEKMLWKKRLFWVKRWKRIWLIEPMQKYVRLHFSSRFSFKKEKKSWKICWLMFTSLMGICKSEIFLWIKLVHHASLGSTTKGSDHLQEGF